MIKIKQTLQTAGDGYWTNVAKSVDIIEINLSRNDGFFFIGLSGSNIFSHQIANVSFKFYQSYLGNYCVLP